MISFESTPPKQPSEKKKEEPYRDIDDPRIKNATRRFTERVEELQRKHDPKELDLANVTDEDIIVALAAQLDSATRFIQMRGLQSAHTAFFISDQIAKKLGLDKL